MMTDKEYIAEFRKDNSKAFADLYKKMRSPFFGYFRNRYLKSDDDIADLYQDSCVKLWQNVKTQRLTEDNLSSSLETYLFSIGRYTMMSKDRKFNEVLIDKEISDANISLPDDEESLRDEYDRNTKIQTTVNDMGEPCKTVLNKYYWENMSGEDIALSMGYKNADTVKTQKYKCMQKLKTVLKKILYD